MVIRAVGMVALVQVLASCGSPLGPCSTEFVEVLLEARRNGTVLSGIGQVSPGNIADFGSLKAALIDGTGQPGQRVSWTADLVAPEGYLSVVLPAKLTAGQVLPIVEIFVGGGFGVLPGSAAGASLAGRVGGHTLTSGTGTIRVVSTTPQVVTIVAELRDESGAIHQIEGTARASYRREASACT